MARQHASANILSPDQLISGLTQAQLGDAWWKLIYAIPVEEHFGIVDDATDPRGRRGSVERAMLAQFKPTVLFVGGAFGELSTGVGGVSQLERSVVLPNNGKATMFMPMLNLSLDNLVNEPDNPDNLTGNLNSEELRNLAESLFNTSGNGGLVSDLFASINGKAVTRPLSHRQASETAFNYTTPFPIEKSLLSKIGYSDDTYLDNADAEPAKLRDINNGESVTIGPAVSDGYWLAVDITGADHTLRFGGTLASDGIPFFSLDITYNVLNSLAGSGDKDSLTGTNRRDYLDGKSGNDDLSGEQGDDLLLGGSGEDIIDGGIGNDQLWGDAGKDTFLYRRGSGSDTIFDFCPGETVRISASNAALALSPIELPSGVSGVQVEFGGQNTLTFVGLQEEDLLIQRGLISHA